MGDTDTMASDLATTPHDSLFDTSTLDLELAERRDAAMWGHTVAGLRLLDAATRLGLENATLLVAAAHRLVRARELLPYAQLEHSACPVGAPLGPEAVLMARLVVADGAAWLREAVTDEAAPQQVAAILDDVLNGACVLIRSCYDDVSAQSASDSCLLPGPRARPGAPKHTGQTQHRYTLATDSTATVSAFT